MSSPSSCIRCSRPLAIESLSGLCQECAATPDSAQSTSHYVPPPPSNYEPPTATAPPIAPESAPTITANPAADTASAPADPRATFPHAPAGYELVDRLGGGGMGVVYLAREVAPDRLVAMKFIRRPNDPESLERFLIELRVLAKLKHPNIIRVLANDFLRADPYFTMDYAEGGALSRMVDSAHPMAPAEAVRVIRTVGGAIVAAHTEKILHRDLKPSNILLTSDGAPLIADFGLAKHLDDTDPLTRTSSSIGTPGYMPPEQISRKNGEIGVWSDVYGLGATLYHLLSGRAPFAGETPEETVHQVLTDSPMRLRAIRPELPAALEGIVLKCLEKEPKDRYQTVAELLADLDRYEAGQKPLAPALTPLRRARRWVGARRRGAIVVAVASVLVLGAFILGAFWPKPKPVEPPDPREEIREALRAGKEVILVGEGNEPRWYQWRRGGGTFGKPPSGKGILFQTINSAHLELLDDPGIDRYTLRVEIQQERSLAPGDQTTRRKDEDFVGAYFGFADLTTANLPTCAYFALWFGDYDPKNPPNGAVEKQPVQLVRVLETLTPQGAPHQQYTRFASYSFTPVVTRPGALRTFEIDVTPEELKARWINDKGQSKELNGIKPMKPVEKYRLLQTDLKAIQPAAGIVLPEWSPRMPLGIYAKSSSVNVQKVTIVPLPNP